MIDVSPKPTRPEPTYLGDGVYARFDGYQVWIYTTDGINLSPSIALNSDTLENLNRYNRQCHA